MKKIILSTLFLSLSLTIFYSCTKSTCKFLGPYYTECPSSGFVSTLSFKGFTMAEVKASVLHYYKANDNFRQKIQTIKFSDVFEINQYGVTDTTVTVKYSQSEFYRLDYDWEIVMQGRAQPYRLTKIQLKDVNCCSQNKPITVKALDSYVMNGKKETLNFFFFNKYF
jgi:hypothetical protein